MSRRVRITISICGVGLLLLLMLVGYALQAVQDVQPFYSAALETEPQLLEDGSREMESRVAVLYSDAVGQPEWQAVFSENEVNGWLAVALTEKYADLLPESVVDPRVAFVEGECLIGYRHQHEKFEIALSVRTSPTVANSDELAIRFRSAHAGKLPLPLAKVVEAVTNFAQEQQIAVHWSHLEGDPVALIPLQGILSTDSEVRFLDSLELHLGELVLSGKTQAAEAKVAKQMGNVQKR